jgi:hypothetical protein
MGGRSGYHEQEHDHPDNTKADKWSFLISHVRFLLEVFGCIAVFDLGCTRQIITRSPSPEEFDEFIAEFENGLVRLG